MIAPFPPVSHFKGKRTLCGFTEGGTPTLPSPFQGGTRFADGSAVQNAINLLALKGGG
jgi:hypothetical protein